MQWDTEGGDGHEEHTISISVNEEAYDRLFSYLDQPEYTKLKLRDTGTGPVSQGLYEGFYLVISLKELGQ
jgi:hypothetical protein